MLESKDLPQPIRDRRPESARAQPGHVRRWLGRVALLPVRYEAHAPAALPPGRVCYVLETDRLLDRLVLEDLCLRERWPLPDDSRAAGFFSVRSIRGWLLRRLVPRDVAELEPVVARVTERGGAPVSFVPIAIFWGRAPQRDSSWISVLSSEDWGLGGRLRRVLAVLVHGRSVLVKVGEPLAVAALAEPDGTRELLARKIGRLLRTLFNDQRTLTIGPDLSHRRLLLDEILESPWVVAAIQREVRSSGKGERRVRARARHYAAEIAADYSYPVVRLLDRAFTWLWNRLYEGVDVRHLETLTEIPAGTELVYVPCHRSHIDYMLLAYVIYRQGLAPPHIAAGVNLNLPILGRILRRGGAFFIRRSFHGNAVYAAVFRSYFHLILVRGFPIKYFIEGGRSRTGRLLQPKLGLLTMTIQSYVADRNRPVVFVPVYFGYEKLVEGQTFIRELSGKAKRKESLGGALRSLGALRERFGGVQVSFGEPLALARVLDETHAGWRTEPVDEQFRPEWLSAAAEKLGTRIMTAINDAAVINPVNLVSLVLLSMPKQAIVEVELRAQLTLYTELAKRAPYAPRSGGSALTADEMIERCERMRWLSRRPHELGDVLYMDERHAVLASYYRNNIVHLYALPALVAAGFVNRSELTAARLRTLVAELYPCLKGELFLRLGRAELEEATDAVVAAMVELGSLDVRAGVLVRPADGSPRAGQLRLCAEILQPFIERYYLCVSLLLAAGSGVLRAAELVRRCRAASEQLALIYALNSPDLFQAELFDTWVEYLRGAALLGEDSGGVLSFDEGVLAELAAALGFVLPAGLRQTLVSLAGTAAPPPSG